MDFEALLQVPGSIEERQARLDRIAGRKPHREFVSIQGCDIQDIDISGLDLSAFRISHGTIRRVACSGTTFGRLTGCTLDSVAGEGTSFSRCRGCRFVRVQLRRARFPQHIVESAFAEADLTGIEVGPNVEPGDWHPSDGLRVRFRGARMDCGDLAGATLAGCCFAGAQLARARLSSAHLVSSDFAEADLSGANLLMANLMGATFRSANLRRALVTSEQKAYLANSASADVASCVVPQLPAAVEVRTIEHLLSRVRDYFLSWDMRDDVTGKSHRVMVSCDEKLLPLSRATAIKSRLNWRDYAPTGPKPLSAILNAIACDYLGWKANCDSLEVQGVNARVLARLLPSLRRMLDQMSSTDLC
jgi:uncharacterized protein YjbI with pentapeptide repeats